MRKVIVVKFGSELVTDIGGVDQIKINRYARGLVDVYNPASLIVVTSGAVRAGHARVKSLDISNNVESVVTLSQLGAASIVAAWEKAFAKAGVLAGGLLVTHNELKDESEGPHFINALNNALESRVVSIVNENDALSDTELMKLAVGGDNDGLAAHIAIKVGASKLVLFTAKGGVVDEEGALIEIIDSNNRLTIEETLQSRDNKKQIDGVGRGGMVSKFRAASSAASYGIESKIAKPATDMNGEHITNFVVG